MAPKIREVKQERKKREKDTYFKAPLDMNMLSSEAFDNSGSLMPGRSGASRTRNYTQMCQLQSRVHTRNQASKIIQKCPGASAILNGLQSSSKATARPSDVKFTPRMSHSRSFVQRTPSLSTVSRRGRDSSADMILRKHKQMV